MLQLCPPRALPFPDPQVTAQAPWLTLLAALGCASPQAVLQQLVGTCWAGTCHQAHSGLMEEDLEGTAGQGVRGRLAQG